MKKISIALSIISIILFNCSKNEKELVSEWQLTDISTMAISDTALNIVSEAGLLGENNQDAQKTFEGYNEKEKKRFLGLVKTSVKRKLRKHMKHLYLSFYEDHSFNGLITPYYIEGNWKFSNVKDSLDLSFTENGKQQYVTAFYEIKDANMFIILNKATGKELFGIDTLKMKRKSLRIAYHSPEYNKWRNIDGDVKTKIKNHIDYLISFFEDVIAKNEKSVNLDYSILATPFIFYEKGIGVQEKDSDSMKYWEKTFKSNEDFEKAFQLLFQAFPKCKLGSFEGTKFELYIRFLKQLKEKV